MFNAAAATTTTATVDATRMWCQQQQMPLFSSSPLSTACAGLGFQATPRQAEVLTGGTVGHDDLVRAMNE
ncbi:hypothetical protein IWW38_002256, partial [Coemansia aciculifera]